ncbi:beta-ketoacyl-[acyl-carrier-protein] synthase II [Acidihalobacter yilgarnensis]|uniref:3-oxoacyl-[acyl-carrier-protein] synthase 2 n=1 Tax=Acidihalobacter yilgarnensis TaxID=2819280 RepID=A0A1D8INQ7_9GAMM|nr:beta-ketoacyl-ACP synthase II [Acidihalobacter yilgarnensis]AOU98100.1 beta-ketoacyl-[acyl-carrier-protein] synthase II [Acidihalobacter yilgarnensis]
MSKRRVVVTGLGIVSPVGSKLETAWENILAGRSGVTHIDHFDAVDSPVKISGAVRDFDVDEYITPKDQKKMDIFVHYGMGAAIQAIRDAGIEADDEKLDFERIGVAIGSGIGGLPGIEKGHIALMNGGPRKVSPFFIPSSLINMVSGNLSIMYGFKGPNIAIVTACTTGTHNIGDAARMIAYGDADVMVAGGAEMASTPLCISGFAAARALSTRNDDPAGASRPWDRDRDGFVIGDGAGVLVLESYEHAMARGARIYCELAGYALNADAYHMTQPSGEGATRCMKLALRDAGMNAEAVDYINAHGTSTSVGDRAESDAIKRAFGNHAEHLAVSSTKSMTGHLLGAAGGVEAVFSILALRDQVLPPTINLDHPDEGCDLDYVPNTARETQVNCALSNSFGFGGTNGSLLFRKI